MGIGLPFLHIMIKSRESTCKGIIHMLYFISRFLQQETTSAQIYIWDIDQVFAFLKSLPRHKDLLDKVINVKLTIPLSVKNGKFMAKSNNEVHL